MADRRGQPQFYDVTLTAKDGAEDYGNCAGLYRCDPTHEISAINGELWYRNAERDRIMAWNGNSWIVTAAGYLQDIATTSGFGGFCGAIGVDPDVAEWENYRCSRDPEFLFERGFNYPHHDVGTVAGVASLEAAQAVFREHPEADMFVYGPPGSGVYGEGVVWLKAAAAWANRRPDQEGQFAGFRRSRFEGLKLGPGSDTSLWLSSEGWTVLPNTTVTFKACANGGACRTDADLQSERHRCLTSDCGGFARIKAHYNRHGEEDDPPKCFFFRKTQAELREHLRADDRYDLYLAPEAYRPDTSFKAGRDPAPSCHIRWETEGPVHAFACQVEVLESSPCTYFATTGFHCGYGGIQQCDGSTQQILFSVWDNPDVDARVENRSTCEGTKPEPFGGEGKGMGAYCREHPTAAWKVGEVYTQVVRALAVDGGTEYAAYLHKPGAGWQEFARHFRPEVPGDRLHGKLAGLYSFVEDFAGNSLRRRGAFAGFAQEHPGAPWQAVTRVTGTSTAELETPNKCVARRGHGGAERLEVAAGGGELEECGLFAGEIKAPPVPDVLLELPAP